MNRNSAITRDRFRPRRGNHNLALLLHQRERKLMNHPKLRPLHLDLLVARDLSRDNLDIADGGLQLHAPVHHAGISVHQSLLPQPDECRRHGPTEPGVAGVVLSARRGRRANALALLQNPPTRLLPPVLDLGDERVAAELLPRHPALRQQLSLHHRLRRDSRVVRAGRPDDGVALHSVVSCKRVFNG